MSDNTKLEKLIIDLTTQVSEMKVDINDRFDRLEDQISDVRDEMRAEGAATRTLIHQAFEHITELQMKSTHSFSFDTGSRSYPRASSSRK